MLCIYDGGIKKGAMNGWWVLKEEGGLWGVGFDGGLYTYSILYVYCNTKMKNQ